MTLGQILEKVAEDDKAGGKKQELSYEEYVKEGTFWIKLRSEVDKDAYIQCSVPDNGLEEEKNYLRSYFLSMVFNAAIFGMKRKKSIKNNN